MKVGDPKLDAIVKRPVKHLAHFGAAYPQLWREHDQVRAALRAEMLWPKWCYAPFAVAAGCLYPECDMTYEDTGLVSNASAMAAWRTTKGIYLFDETMFNYLWQMPVEGDLPVEHLQHLPDWCVYVPFPNPRILQKGPDTPSISLPTSCSVTCHGFFAHLDSDPNGTTWLFLTLDIDDPGMCLSVISVKLIGNLSESCKPFRDALKTELNKALFNTCTHYAELPSLFQCWGQRQEAELIRPLVSILLYLCSTTREVRERDPLRGLRTRVVRTKRGIRTFGPEKPRMFEVAYRIGASLRKQAEEVAAHNAHASGTHASPRMHIRRAHWASYWTGPRASVIKNQPTERKLILHWLPPIVVCGEKGETVIPTVHPVLPPNLPMDQLDAGAMQ